MSFARRLIAAILVPAMASGCSGRVVTQRLNETQMQNSEAKMSGVVVYQPALLAEVSVMTTYVSDGKLVGRATDSPPACMQVPSEKVVMLPDLARPYLIAYEPGPFETNKFGVTLNNGMVAAVNAQPTMAPPAVPNILPSGVSSVAGAANPIGFLVTEPRSQSSGRLYSAAMRDELPVCNDGPVVIGHRRLALP